MLIYPDILIKMNSGEFSQYDRCVELINCLYENGINYLSEQKNLQKFKLPHYEVDFKPNYIDVDFTAREKAQELLDNLCRFRVVCWLNPTGTTVNCLDRIVFDSLDIKHSKKQSIYVFNTKICGIR